MTTTEYYEGLLTAEPFRPFFLLRRNGSRIPVDSPEAVTIGSDRGSGGCSRGASSTAFASARWPYRLLEAAGLAASPEPPSGSGPWMGCEEKWVDRRIPDESGSWEVTMAAERRRLRRVSLWASVLGLVLPVLLALVVAALLAANLIREAGSFAGLLLMLCGALESVALACGLGSATVARRQGGLIPLAGLPHALAICPILLHGSDPDRTSSDSSHSDPLMRIRRRRGARIEVEAIHDARRLSSPASGARLFLVAGLVSGRGRRLSLVVYPEGLSAGERPADPRSLASAQAPSPVPARPARRAAGDAGDRPGGPLPADVGGVDRLPRVAWRAAGAVGAVPLPGP